MKDLRLHNLLLAGIVAVSAFTFFVDVQFPLGLAGGIPYALVVMATYWITERRYTVAVGILSTLLTVLGFFYSDPSQYFMYALANRVMAVFIIWGTVWFVINYKNSLSEIRKNEKWISALVEAATIGIIISDMKGRIIFLNKKAEELFGYSRDELIGEKVEILVPKGNNGQDNLISDNSSAVHLYRIAQEAITNAVKHGNASKIDVEFYAEEDNLILRIEDDGSGFTEADEMGDGMGVRIMNFRAQMINGTLEINSTDGEGTEIICQIPSSNL